jgi:carbonic anhydrase/acetyltransferase-like protein (isoleucine patch superfamily)
MALFEFDGKTPVVGSATWIADSAEIIGDVKIGKRCWIGPNAVIRGDFGTIIIGDDTAVEDGVIIHTPSEVKIGNFVTIGHMAMIHGRLIKDYAVVGMNSTMGDNSEVGSWSIVAEHSLVKKNQIVPDYKLFAGAPAVEKGDVEDKYKEIMLLGKQMYAELVIKYSNTLRRIEPS